MLSDDLKQIIWNKQFLSLISNLVKYNNDNNTSQWWIMNITKNKYDGH